MKKLISILIIAIFLLHSFSIISFAEGDTASLAAQYADYEDAIHIYVSSNGDDKNDGSEGAPFKSIEKAKEYVSSINKICPIVVNILSGEYFIDEKINFDAYDSGKGGNKVIYRGVGDKKPLISGGVKVGNNWTDADGDGIYEISVPNVADARQMYVNGFAMQRAKSDKYYNAELSTYKRTGSSHNEDGFILTNYALPKFKHPEELEIVSHILWTTHRMPVQGVVYDSFKDKTLFIMKQPNYDSYLSSGQGFTPKVGARIWIENAFEFLDEAGEFYFDKTTRKLYYKPFAEDDLSTAEIYLPKSEGLLSLVGTEQNKISNISFENLDFRHGAYNDVTKNGFSVLQSDCIFRPDMHGQLDSTPNPAVLSQIYVENAEKINFRDCNFSNLGSAAIGMMLGVTDCEITRNTIHDISATAIIVGSWRYSIESDPETLCHGIVIEDNLIRGVGQEFMSSPAIGVYYAKDVYILSNDIKDTPYTGITLGWGWGVPVPNVLDCGSYRVIGNRIEDTMRERQDGGAIYTLGYLSNTLIKENYIIDCPDNGAIYLDSGSASISIQNNVFKDCARWLFTGMQDNVIAKDNYVENNTYSFTPNTEAGKESYISGTVVYENGNWSGDALAVVQSAGLSPYASSVLSITERPEHIGTVYDYLPIEEMCVPGDYILEAEDYVGTNVPAGSIYIYTSHTNDRVVLSDFRAGQSYEYKVVASEAAQYNLAVRYTTGPSPEATSMSADVYVNGNLQLSSSDVSFGPSVGSWYVCPSEDIGTLSLQKGENIIKFTNRTDSWVLDNLRLTKVD